MRLRPWLYVKAGYETVVVDYSKRRRSQRTMRPRIELWLEPLTARTIPPPSTKLPGRRRPVCGRDLPPARWAKRRSRLAQTLKDAESPSSWHRPRAIHWRRTWRGRVLDDASLPGARAWRLASWCRSRPNWNCRSGSGCSYWSGRHVLSAWSRDEIVYDDDAVAMGLQRAEAT